MSTPKPRPQSPYRPATHRPLPPATIVTVLVLLAIPTLAILIVPIYASATPRLWGWPFFYWYQVLWVPASAVFTGAAYVLVKRARSTEVD